MNRTFLKLLLCGFVLQPFMTIGAPLETNPMQVAAAFQKIPHYEMFCQTEVWESVEPIKVGEKFKEYLSQKFYRLFQWSQCVEPEIPPHYREREFKGVIYWDFRFGFSYSGMTGENSILAENIRLQKAKLYGTDKATIKVLYDFGTLKNLVTTYTLIREDGHWKIDDIAPKGDYVEEGDQEPFLEHSDSIKTDMQKNYDAAEARYKLEQAKKH